MMPLPRQNFELKARCLDLAAARQALVRLDPRAGGVEEQTDTYFHCPTGRLKLREIAGKSAVLIWYNRSNDAKARACQYHLSPVPDPQSLKVLLTEALGRRAVVRKQREIWFWHNVRIHFDAVEGLGQFIELEAVLSEAADLELSRQRVDELGRLLAIRAEDILGMSNVDMA